MDAITFGLIAGGAYLAWRLISSALIKPLKPEGGKPKPPRSRATGPASNLSEVQDWIRQRNAGEPVRMPSPSASTLPRNRKAWRGNKRVTFMYMDSKGDITTRDVNAVRVDHKNGETYLVGYCMTRRATRTFRADRIIGEVIDMETGEVGNFTDIFG